MKSVHVRKWRVFMKKTDRLWWKKATAWMLTAAVTCSLPGTPVFGSPETGGLFGETENSEWQDAEIEKATDSNAQKEEADPDSAEESAESREEQSEGEEITVSKATASDAQEKEDDEGVNTDADAETKTIVSWTWKEKNGEETLIDGKLLLTNGTEESQPSFDDIVSMLPEKIRADVEWESASGAKTQAESGDEDADEEIFLEGTVEDTQIITLDGWNCDEYEQDTDGLWPMTGTFLFEAELPEGYELADEAGALSVEVVMEEPGIAVMDDEGNWEKEKITVEAYSGIYDGKEHALFTGVWYDNGKINWLNNGVTLKIKKNGTNDEYSPYFSSMKVKNVSDNNTKYKVMVVKGSQEIVLDGLYGSNIKAYNLGEKTDKSISIAEPRSYVYDGKDHTPVVASVVVDDMTLVENTDYTLYWCENNNIVHPPLKDAGIYVPVVKAKSGGNFIGELGRTNTTKWIIDQKPVSLNITGNEKNYDGKQNVSEDFEITLDESSILDCDKDNVILKAERNAFYEDASAGLQKKINISWYKLTDKDGKTNDNYRLPTIGDKPAITGIINPAEITNISVEQTGTLTYNGAPQQPMITASATTVEPRTDSPINPPTFCYSADPKASTDKYTTDVPKFTEAGDHILYYVAKANNHNDAQGNITVHIETLDLSQADGISGTLNKDTVEYNGEVQKPELTVKLGDNVIDPKNYTVQYIDPDNKIVTEPVNAGTYKIQITGQGSCTGTKVLDEKFTISKRDMGKLENMNIAIGYRTKGKLEYPITGLPADGDKVSYIISYSVEDTSNLFYSGDVDVTVRDDKLVLILNMGGYTKDQIDHTATVSLHDIETDNYIKGSMDIIITITDRGTQTQVPTADMTFTQNSDGETFTAEIAKVTGAEYSFDGTTWSAENRKTDCLPDTAYTGYIRFAETDDLNPGPAASVTKRTGKISAQAPVANPAGKTFQGTLNVTLTTATKDAKIFYTLDGTTPTESSSRYTGPITVSDSVTLKAIAVKTNLETSPVLTEVYTKQASNNTNNGSTSGGSGASGGGSSSDRGTTSSGIRVDAQKGRVSSSLGIITGENNKRGGDGYSHWIQDERGWWLCYSDGSYPQGSSNPEQQAIANSGEARYQWELVNGRWFAFNPEGYMATGWIINQGTWYYLEPDGAMKTGWVKVGDTWYYLNADGSMRTDGIYLDGVYHRFDPETGAWIAG